MRPLVKVESQKYNSYYSSVLRQFETFMDFMEEALAAKVLDSKVLGEPEVLTPGTREVPTLFALRVEYANHTHFTSFGAAAKQTTGI